MTPCVTATHETVTRFAAWVENVGHKMYMDSFSSPGLPCGLCTQAVKYCGTARTNKTWMSMSLREKTKLKYVDIKTRMRGNLRETGWKDKQNVNTMPNMCHP